MRSPEIIMQEAAERRREWELTETDERRRMREKFDNAWVRQKGTPAEAGAQETSAGG